MHYTTSRAAAYTRMWARELHRTGGSLRDILQPAADQVAAANISTAVRSFLDRSRVRVRMK